MNVLPSQDSKRRRDRREKGRKGEVKEEWKEDEGMKKVKKLGELMCKLDISPPLKRIKPMPTQTQEIKLRIHMKGKKSATKTAIQHRSSECIRLR